MKMRFLPDAPITSKEADLLGFGPFVELIELSLVSTEPPFVYGVLGNWGVGKTSVLHLLQERLRANREGARRFIPIWFNAWKYENEANLIYPLLHAIKRQYQADTQAEASPKFRQRFKQVVATSSLALTDVGLRTASHYLTGQAIKLEDVQKQLETIQKRSVEALEKALGDWADQVDQLQTAFEALLDAYAGEVAGPMGVDPTQVRFVILIDDLDRCLPETTIAILESIKNYLAAGPSIFVLALNAKVIYQGIKAKYKELEIDGREYLEKILNYTFYVPEPALKQVGRFATQRLTELLVDARDRADLEQYLKTFGEVLEGCQFNNPRKIKRILNRYLLLISRYEPKIKTKSYNLESLIRLLVLAEYYPILFGLLYSSKEPLNLITEFDRWTTYAELEQAHDIAIPPTYPPLSSLKPWLDLKASPYSLGDEIEIVFGMTRII